MKTLRRLMLGIAALLMVAASAWATSSGSFQNQSLDYESLGYTWAGRPTYSATAHSKVWWCRDCQIQVACTSGGSGAWAWWATADNSWHCAGNLPTNLLTTTSAFAGDVTGTYNTTLDVGWDGILLDSTMATPTNGYVPQYQSGSNKWVAVTPPSGVSTLQVYSNNYNGSGITIGASTAIFNRTFSMPSTGCPCRIRAFYGIGGNQAASGASSTAITSWIYDGTNRWAGGGAIGTGNNRPFDVTGSDFSPSTYSNSASVTITLAASDLAASGWVAKINYDGSNLVQTYMHLEVFPSN